MFLSLLGTGGELVRDGNEWFLRSGSLALTVRESFGDFQAYDGVGRTYTFTKLPYFGATGLWLLKSITAAGGASVELTYDVRRRTVQDWEGLEVNLTSIAYNTHPFAGCAKHEIRLTYVSPPTPGPLAISLAGDKTLVRFRLLSLISVMSRSTCNTPPESIRTYRFDYPAAQIDPDTKLPRLGSVIMYGRQGSPEATTPLPVASYEYGSATKNGNLNYQITQTIDFAPEADGNMVAATALDSSVSAPVPGERYAMWQSLIDVTGDGRPDLVYKKNNKLQVALNRPAAGGRTTIGYPFINGQGLVPLQDSTFNSGALAAHTSAERRFYLGAANRNMVNVWRQAIDVNGDGRMDIVDAGTQPGYWIVYLNTPGGPNGFKWVRRSWSVRALADELKGKGHVIPGDYVPLSRRTTGVSLETEFCIERVGTGPDIKFVPYIGFLLVSNPDVGSFTFLCVSGRPTNWPPPPLMPPPPPPIIEPEKTFVEWDFTDVNGDGYPDFVFNTTPALFVLSPINPSNDLRQVTRAKFTFQLTPDFPSNQIRVAYNIIGVRQDDVEPRPFSSTVVASLPGAGDSGVAAWQGQDPDGNIQLQTAGFADVNGDGLQDRVVWDRVYLGIYRAARAFSDAYITLPNSGRLSRQISSKKIQCEENGGPVYTSRITQGLRDLTGDGIPDYYDNSKGIAIGTGAGFAPWVGIESGLVEQFQFSHQTESCDGDFSNTDGGLFDIDGDGRPEIILVDHQGGQPRLTVSQLTTGPVPRAPEAGKLISINSGYGAVTRIAYRSAKEDLYSFHEVPFPEIVVTAIKTVGTHGLGGSLAGTRYAYGKARLIFDSSRDAFVFPGYERTVELKLYKGQKGNLEGAATIVDNWPLTSFSPALKKEERWLRIQRTAQVSDIYTLRGSNEVDPWRLLAVSATDSRIIGASHREWMPKLFEAPMGGSLRDCIDVVDPYDFNYSFAAAIGQNGLLACRAHGFAFGSLLRSWYGGSPPTSANNIQTGSRVLEVDDYGQVLSAQYDNDLFRGDDDICVENIFATPSQIPHVINAVASQRMTDCSDRRVLASRRFEYDGLPTGSVTNGRLTSHVVDRRATDTGALLGSIRMFDATYDLVGNLVTTRRARDGDKQTVTLYYDQFGIVPVSQHLTATGIPPMSSYASHDPVTLVLLETIDRNGTRRGTDFDGWGRPVRRTIGGLGGPQGILWMADYQGFSGNNPMGRQISVTSYSDPVAPAHVPNAAGRTAIKFYDELGRERRTEVLLGADYANDRLVVNEHVYDDTGRLAFQADPYPKSQASTTTYGTTYHYKNTGDLDCLIRGQGHQPLNKVTDISSERLPTCFNRSFANNLAVLDVQDASSLQPGSMQAGVIRRKVSTAIGWVVESSTLKGGRLDHAVFGYDRLGQIVSMTRYLDPVAASKPVYWSWQLDSLGRTLQTYGPESATRNFIYSDWGELIKTEWMDGPTNRQLIGTFDAIGRLTRTEDRNNGIVDPETVNTFSYDTTSIVSPYVEQSFLLGRLASARWPKGDVSFSYNTMGRVSARVFRDNDGTSYVDAFEYHADGSLAALSFKLPDRNYDSEIYKYSYDSAGRLRSITASDLSTKLYKADDIDPLGRIRKATYGANIVYAADFAGEGRRLVREVEISSPLGSRNIAFLGFDPLGRELSRHEVKNGAPSGVTSNASYDALGRLALATRTEGPATLSSWQFQYDPLGNVTSLADLVGAADATLSYGSGDRDRLCRVDYGNVVVGPVGRCNVLHDTLGNIVSQVTRTGSRQLRYFSSGALRAIASTGTLGQFGYDPFDQLQSIDFSGPSEERHNRRYGRLIERREMKSGGSTVTQLVRRVPGRNGIIATRGGPGSPYIFPFGELRGSRFFVHQNGTFLQEVNYEPFGESTSIGAQPGAADYTSYQWNGGDELSQQGLFYLGARVYDPVIGRFLSRDPILLVRGAGTTNPYAFARNDPVNFADPTGFDPEGDAQGDLFDTIVSPTTTFIDIWDLGVQAYIHTWHFESFAHEKGHYSAELKRWVHGKDWWKAPDLTVGKVPRAWEGLGLVGDTLGVVNDWRQKKYGEAVVGSTNVLFQVGGWVFKVGARRNALITAWQIGTTIGGWIPREPVPTTREEIKAIIEHQKSVEKIERRWREGVRSETRQITERLQNAVCVEEMVCRIEALVNEPSEEDWDWFWNWPNNPIGEQGPAPLPVQDIVIPPELMLKEQAPRSVAKPHPFSPAATDPGGGWSWPTPFPVVPLPNPDDERPLP